MVTRRHVIRALVFSALLAAPAPALGSGWVYVESNNPSPGRNSVLALNYGASGALNPVRIREFRTRGTGAALIPGKAVGTLAGDQQITLSRDKRWLYAVNQGSNSIAVFRVNHRTGNLTPAQGSPFDSGGRAPISIGVRGRYIVVANHGVVAPFEPGPAADFGMPNFTSFRVSTKGRLTKISSTPAGPGPTQAAISASGRNVFSTSFYSFGDPANKTIQSLRLSPSGQLVEAPGSPTGFPASMTTNLPPLPPLPLPPGLERLPFGIATHPSRPYAYIVGPLSSRVAIYRHDAAGTLTFAGQEDNPGALGACWAVMTSDGRYLFTGNSGSQDVSTFRVSPSGNDLAFVGLTKAPSTGTVFNVAVDPSNRYLYAVAGHDDPDIPRPQSLRPDGTIVPTPADGNFVEAFRIGGGGRLTAISSTALPVRSSQLPYGLATVRKR